MQGRKCKYLMTLARRQSTTSKVGIIFLTPKANYTLLVFGPRERNRLPRRFRCAFHILIQKVQKAMFHRREMNRGRACFAFHDFPLSPKSDLFGTDAGIFVIFQIILRVCHFLNLLQAFYAFLAASTEGIITHHIVKEKDSLRRKPPSQAEPDFAVQSTISWVDVLRPRITS